MKKKNTHSELGFKVPDGYFKSNEDRLFHNIKAVQQSKELPFSVPSGYFERLDQRVLDNVEIDSINTATTPPFEVPHGYFEQLEDRVMANVTSINTDGSTTDNPFTVPQDYFERAAQRTLEATVDKPVVKLNSDLPSWVIPMIAVAAIFVAVLAIDGFWPSNVMTIEDLGNEELAIYLAETDFTMDEEMSDIFYSDVGILDNASFEDHINDDDLLDYFADEVEMNQMIEE